MYYIFKNEIRRKFKNPVIWILIVIIIFLLYINTQRSFESNEFDNILNYTPNLVTLDEETSIKMMIEDDVETYEDYNENNPGSQTPSFYKLNADINKKYLNAYYNNDLKEKYRLKSFQDLLYANYYANSVGNNNSYLSQYVSKIANDELWDELSNGVKYQGIDFTNSGEFGLYPTISAVFDAKYNYYLSQNNLNHIESDAYIEFNNLYVINKWIKEIIPILLIIILIIISYDSINKDVKDGSTKLLVTQSISRWKYYLGKFFASITIVVFVIITSVIITNTANIYLKSEIKSEPMNYPIVYDKQGLTRLKPSFNYMEKNLEIYEQYEYRAFYKIPYSKMEPLGLSGNINIPLYQRNTDLIGFDKFLLLTFVYAILFIMFMISFIQLCSAIFNNTILSLLATTGVYGFFYSIFEKYLHGKNYNLCPFTMNNSARIVAGTHNVTMLTAFLVLVSSTLLLLLIGIRYFKKKEI